MNNYQKTKDLVDKFVKEHGMDVEMTRSEFIKWVHETYDSISIEKNNMSPTDICYNRYNTGLIDFPGETLCLEYVEERNTFRLIGSGYAYTGPVFAYKNRKNETLVGKWENGKYTWLTDKEG